MIAKTLEDLVFRWRAGLLVLFAALTLVTGFFAVQIRLDAGFDKQLPAGHPYVETFQEYRDQLFGSNRIIVVLRAREGTIWNKEFLIRLKALTDDIFFLPGVDRRTVTSLWTPNTRYFEITEEGFRADNVIPGTVTAETMDADAIARIENNVMRGRYVGRLVSNDFTSAMVVAELQDIDPGTREALNYFDLAEELESEIRSRYEDEAFEVHIVGFAKMVGDIRDGLGSVFLFFTLALLITAGLVYWYSRSLVLTLVPLGCSLTSLIWQFGVLSMLGYGLDPLAILVPFLVFAIGVSHGVQQINLISKRVEAGASSEDAARTAFSGLLIPGSMALVTDLVGFGTLYFIQIPMIQEMAVTASIGIALKIVTNLVMLPLVASYFTFDASYVDRIAKARAYRLRIMSVIGGIARPPVAVATLSVACALFAVAVWQSHGRHVGDLHAGAPELHPDARNNYDSRVIADSYSLGLNVLTVVVETPTEACIKHPYMDFIARLSWTMENVPGVLSVVSLATQAQAANAGWNEGNPKWHALPRNTYSLVQATAPIPTSSGLLNSNCSILPVMIFTEDSRAETLERVVATVKTWRDENGLTPVLNQGQDQKDGRWTLRPRDLQGLVFTPPPLADTVQTFNVELFKPGSGGTLTSIHQAGIQFDLGTARQPLGLDLRAALPDAPWDEATRIVLSDVPGSTYVRLASGNAGVMAATNEVIRKSELPMMLVVYAVIILMVFGTYRDWRATLACCVPLTIATFLGYWFMKELEIGLKVATLPVMVLAVGLGVDYAFYIYNRIQYHLRAGLDIVRAYRQTMYETGMAVVFVALTMAMGVLTWVFSDLKFQADMGLLLSFMFMINMIMAITVLPALAVVMDMAVPRRGPPVAEEG